MAAVTSLEVSTVFRAIDKATSVIQRINKAVLELNDNIEWAQLNLSKLGTQSFSKLDAALAKTTQQFDAMNESIDAGLVSMTSATRAAEASATALARSWRTVQEAATGAATAASRVAMAAPPGLPRGRDNGGMKRAGEIGLAALGYGTYEQAKAEDYAFRGVFTAGMPKSQAVVDARMRQLQEIMQSASSTTGASVADIGESTLTELRMMQGYTWKQKMDLLPAILRFGAAEARLKHTSVEEGTSVAIGLAHMFGAYSPKQVEALGNKFGFLSTMTQASPEGLERALGYTVPVLKDYGYNPWQVAMLTAMMQRAGILNTKSGTWIRNMAQMALPGTTAQSKTAFTKHEEALKKFGLVDANGHPTFFDSDGNPDIIKLLTLAGTNINKLPPALRAGVAKQLFGQQGSGALAVLSNPQLLKMLGPTQEAMNNFKSGSDFFQQYYYNSPTQQADQAWANFRNVLMDISTIVLPPLTGALQRFDDMLKEIQKWLPDSNGSFGKAVGKSYGYGIATGNPVLGLGAGAWGALKYWWNGGASGPADDQAKKALKDSTKEGTKEGAEDALKDFHKSAYWGGGLGGPMLTPAMYTAGGGSAMSGGVAYSPSLGGGGGSGSGVRSVPNYPISTNPAVPALGLPGGGAAPFGGYHWTTSQIWTGLGGKSSDLAGSYSAPDLAGLKGNSYIKAVRSGFGKELSDPNKRLQFAAMLLSEGNPLQTAESAMNRSSFQHKTLMQALHSGFYGPINRGQLPAFMRRLQNNPKLMAKMNAAIDAALAGSDTIKGSTDQGMVSDPNGGYILHHFHVWGKGHGNIYGDWNGGRGTERWRHNFEEHADETGNDSSPALASHAASQQSNVIKINVDGKTIANVVHKHSARMGNMPARSARQPDPYAQIPSFPV